MMLLTSIRLDLLETGDVAVAVSMLLFVVVVVVVRNTQRKVREK